MTSVPPSIPPGPAGRPGAPDEAGAPVAAGPEVSLPVALLTYTALRLLLVAVLTAVLTIFMPLIVALLFAFVLQLPLAWVLFGKWRRQVNEGMARATATRRSERARLQGALSGDPSTVGPSTVDPSTVERSVVDRSVVDRSVVDRSVVDRSGERPAGPGGTDHPSPRS